MSKNKIEKQTAKIDKWAHRIWKDHRRNGLRIHFDKAKELAPQVMAVYAASQNTTDCKAIRKMNALASVRPTSRVPTGKTSRNRWQHGFG